MRNRNLIAYSILAVCLENLLDFTMNSVMEEPTLWVDEESRSISLQQYGPGYRKEPLYIISNMMIQWIKEYLDESKIVILYACSDNKEIALSNPKDFTEDLSILEDWGIPELTHILYMAND